MKTKTSLFTAIVLCVMLFNVITVEAQWVQITTQSAQTFVVKGQNIIAGTWGYGIIRSTDNGQTWNSSNDGFTEIYVYDLIVNGDNIFASAGDKIFLSTNDGISWTSTNDGIPQMPQNSIQHLAVCGTNIFALTGYGVYRSTNNGINWVVTNDGLPNSSVTSILVNGTDIYLGTSNNGVYLSTNNGTNWINYSPLNNGLPENTSVLSLSIAWQNLFIVTKTYNYPNDYFSIYRTTDNGVSWKEAMNGLPKCYFKLVVIDNNLYVGTDWGIYRSSNNGFNWQSMNSGFPLGEDKYIYSFVANSSDLYTIATDGIYTFENLSKLISIKTPPKSEKWDMGSNQTITWEVIGISNVKLEYSSDRGISWNPISVIQFGQFGDYTWLIPNTPSDQCYIKITDSNNKNHYAISDVFTIAIPARNTSLLVDTIITNNPCYVNVMFHALDTLAHLGVQNLLQQEFNILEDSNPLAQAESRLQIGKSDQLNYSLKAVLMIDNSSSIGSNLQTVKDAAIKFIQNKMSNEQVAIYYFSENPVLVRDFTSNANTLIDAINSIPAGFASTNLYGSIITGLNRWNDIFSLTNVDEGILVLLTDGTDTQGSSTIQEVLAARVNKKIVTVGIGNSINPTILQQIGNSGYYQVDNFSQLEQKFTDIQQYIISLPGSFYWLNYITPKRGDKNHTLNVSLNNNQNTGSHSSFQAYFNSNGFYSFVLGIVVNPTPQNVFGIDTLVMPSNGNVAVTIETPFTFYSQPYQLQVANPQLLSVETSSSSNQFRFVGIAQEGQKTNVLIKDVSNDFSKTLYVRFEGPTSVQDNDLPTEFALHQNYPNPFNPTTTINYSVPKTSFVTIKVYNVLGKEVAVLVNDEKIAGNYKVEFNADKFASGVYFYKMQTGNFISTKKLILLK